MASNFYVYQRRVLHSKDDNQNVTGDLGFRIWRLGGCFYVLYAAVFATNRNLHRPLQRVVYATYVGVGVVACRYCISDGLQDGVHEDKTAVADPTEPLRKVGRRTRYAGTISLYVQRRSKNAQLEDWASRLDEKGTHEHVQRHWWIASVPKVLVCVTDDVNHLHDDYVGLLVCI